MKKISEHLFQISLGNVNAFIIEDKGLTLIDTGYKNSMNKIVTAIKKAGRNPDDIKQIILTHCHPDHAGSAAAISKIFNVPVYAHAEEALLIEKGISGRLPMHLTPGFINWMVYCLFIKNSPKHNEPLEIAEKLIDNDVLPVAGGLQIIHTPGHSAGHISLLLKNEGVLIAGDICANVSGLALSTVYEDVALGIKSILKVSDFYFDKAVFGHGKAITEDAQKKLKNRFSHDT